MITAALLQEVGSGRLETEVRSIAGALGRRGVPCQFFVEKQLQRRRFALSPATLAAGHIPVVVGALRQLGVEPPEPDA